MRETSGPSAPDSLLFSRWEADACVWIRAELRRLGWAQLGVFRSVEPGDVILSDPHGIVAYEAERLLAMLITLEPPLLPQAFWQAVAPARSEGERADAPTPTR